MGHNGKVFAEIIAAALVHGYRLGPLTGVDLPLATTGFGNICARRSAIRAVAVAAKPLLRSDAVSPEFVYFLLQTKIFSGRSRSVTLPRFHTPCIGHQSYMDRHDVDIARLSKKEVDEVKRVFSVMNTARQHQAQEQSNWFPADKFAWLCFISKRCTA
jgi:hypothetical protein